MFLFRLGKEKLAFTLTISILKLKYSHIDSLNSNHQFQIEIQRGSHRLKFLNQINKKGVIKVDKQSQSFPMTLYFDKTEKKFEKKQMIIKGRVINEFNQKVFDLGDAEMDIAQYANEDSSETKIQVELYGQKEQVCKVIFSIKIQKNKEGCFTETDTLNSEEKRTNKSKQKYDAKSMTSKRNEKNNQIQQKSEPQLAKRNKSKDTSLKDEPPKKNEYTLTRYNKDTILDNQQKNYGNASTVRSNSVNKFDLQPTSEDNQTVELNKQIPTPPKFKNFQNNIQPSSIELKLFETERLLKEKTKELLKAKKELQAQKKISESLLNEQRKQQNATMSSQTLRQMQNLKTQLMVANMKLSDFQSENRKCHKQLDETQLLNQRQAQQLIYYKNLLQKEKMKMAEAFQMALERGDNDLISFLEELASQQ